MCWLIANPLRYATRFSRFPRFVYSFYPPLSFLFFFSTVDGRATSGSERVPTQHSLHDAHGRRHHAQPLRFYLWCLACSFLHHSKQQTSVQGILLIPSRLSSSYSLLNRSYLKFLFLFVHNNTSSSSALNANNLLPLFSSIFFSYRHNQTASIRMTYKKSEVG